MELYHLKSRLKAAPSAPKKTIDSRLQSFFFDQTGCPLASGTASYETSCKRHRTFCFYFSLAVMSQIHSGLDSKSGQKRHPT
jgi:hypothetical protein